METFILKGISLSGWAFGDSNDVLDILAGDNWILNDFFAIWKEVSYLNNIRIVCFWEHDWYLVTSLFVFLILCIVFLKIYLFLGLFISGAQLSGAQFATFGGWTVGPGSTLFQIPLRHCSFKSSPPLYSRESRPDLNSSTSLVFLTNLTTGSLNCVRTHVGIFGAFFTKSTIIFLTMGSASAIELEGYNDQVV